MKKGKFNAKMSFFITLILFLNSYLDAIDVEEEKERNDDDFRSSQKIHVKNRYYRCFSEMKDLCNMFNINDLIVAKGNNKKFNAYIGLRDEINDIIVNRVIDLSPMISVNRLDDLLKIWPKANILFNTTKTKKKKQLNPIIALADKYNIWSDELRDWVTSQV